MSEVLMMGYGAVAGEAGFEFDEEVVRKKFKELLAHALFHRNDYRGLEATKKEIFWNLLNLLDLEGIAPIVDKFIEAMSKVNLAQIVEVLNTDFEIRRTRKNAWCVLPFGFEVALMPGHTRTKYYWRIKIPTNISFKYRVPSVPLPETLLNAGIRGWLMSDASLDYSRKEVKMGTHSALQAIIFSLFFPGKEVTVRLGAVLIYEKRVSFRWEVVIHGVNVTHWYVIKEKKQAVRTFLEEIREKKEISQEEVFTLFTLFMGDGIAFERSMTFAIGTQRYRFNRAKTLEIARLIYNYAYFFLALAACAKSKKAMLIIQWAHAYPRKTPHYLPISIDGEVFFMTLHLIAHARYARICAELYINKENEEKLYDFAARAARAGLKVRKAIVARRGNKVYYGYRAYQPALLEYARTHAPWVFDILIKFVEENLRVTTNTQKKQSLEKLLKKLIHEKEKALGIEN